MKTKARYLLWTAAIAVTAGVVFYFCGARSENEKPSARGDGPGTLSKAVRAPETTAPAPIVADSEIVPEPTPAPTPDPVVEALFYSPTVPARLVAAQQLAAREDENSFRYIAGAIIAAEMTGEVYDQAFAEQLAAILRQMRGPDVYSIATELAYNPSPLVSEAAADVAVSSDPFMRLTEIGSPADAARTEQLDSAVQTLLVEDSSPEKSPR